MNTTVKKVIEFSNNAIEFLKANKEHTPFTYALSKVQKKCVPVIEKFQKELQEFAEDQRVELCEKEKDGTIKEKGADVRDEAGNVTTRMRKIFTAESETKLRKAIREEEERLLSVDVEVAHHIAKDEYIPTLNLYYIEAFEGFVIPSMTDEQKEALYLKPAVA